MPSPTPGLLVELLVLEQVEDGDADLASGLGGPVDVEELGHHVRAGQDDRLTPVDLGDLGREGVDRGLATTSPVAVRAGRAERGEGRLEVRAERSSQSWRTASRSTSRIVIAGEASTSPAASEPIDDSMREAASSSGSSTW